MIRKVNGGDMLDCSQCDSKSEFIIFGGENCYYCGNEIELCKPCLEHLNKQILETLKE